MVFSSHVFLFYFLPLALVLYYASPRAVKHLSLTLMSYVFYGWWNPWLIYLMFGSTLVDFACGKLITADNATVRQRKTGLWISILVNLSVLAFFKYAGFFAGNVHAIAGTDFPTWVYTIPLPVGISFYTFQSMSYSIDLYRGDARPCRSFVDFMCYVSMFPQLVAGPIVRYGSVAEQLRSRIHSVEGFVAGFTRFNYGFAKKILLANPMGAIADVCFNAGEGSLGPMAAWLGVTAYAFQIYFDFSGYSDMALGLGRMFGFKFPENFNSPYRSHSITDFWRRWHISLSSFLRDYLYIPLGGSRIRPSRTYANLMIVMLIGGLWHGAQWTFIAWGLIHGGMLAIERMSGKDSFYRRLPNPLKIAITFVIVLISWVFFRAENFDVAGRYLGAMFGLNETVAGNQQLLTAYILRPINLVWFSLSAIVIWAVPRVPRILSDLTAWKVVLGLVLLAIAVMMMWTQGFNPFLYFQF
ncbi:MAG: alginate O-acetyltransferase complex protein AlgI [Verrucomicrobiales bacterium]